MWLSLVGVIVGWILAQFTAGIKELYIRWKTKRALLEELTELDDESLRLWLAWGRSLQMVGAGGVDSAVPLPLYHHIFVNHYKDGALAMNKYQRRSMQMIHAYVDAINVEIPSIRLLVDSLQDQMREEEPLSEANFQKYRDKVQGGMYSAAVLQWHIRHHIENQSFPELDPNGPGHQGYLKYLETVRGEIKRIETSGESIDLEKFKRFYIPEMFPERGT